MKNGPSGSADPGQEEPAPVARFGPGDRVRVRVGDPPRHIRTPAYIQGKTGRIEAIHGAFLNPESRAHGASGLPQQFLYRVGFDLNHVWGRQDLPHDRLRIDLYEHWLEKA